MMVSESAEAGRSCPLHYRYRPEQLCLDPTPCEADTLYVVGGLYGNPDALNEIDAMAAREAGQVHLLFNGDFNWFNATPEIFGAINRRVLAADAMAGNVEYELAHGGEGAGCGCAYPDFVENDVVERSNRIMERLQATAETFPELRAALGRLPHWRCLMLGGLKVLVLHGDPESLAGWGLSRECLQASDAQLRHWFLVTGADVILSTHTCLPVIWHDTLAGRPRWLLNNGAAGMGNLVSDSAGLIARVSRTPSANGGIKALSGAGLHFSLEPVRFPLTPWLAKFDSIWPRGSDAALSYRSRIVSGTSVSAASVLLGGKSLTGMAEQMN